MSKRVVHYKNNGLQRISLGAYAIVEPIDHTNHAPGQQVTNTGPVITSKVVRIGSWGEFETQNTIYRPDIVMKTDE